jgi:hypothetical protein
MKKVIIAIAGLGLIAGPVALAAPASAVKYSCDQLKPYKVKELKNKYKNKKRSCIREEKRQANSVPPAVSNLSIGPSADTSDYYAFPFSYYARTFQVPEAALGNIAKFEITEGDEVSSELVYGGGRKCEDGVCTYTRDYQTAPWGSTHVIGVTTVGKNGKRSEMALTSAVFPAAPSQNYTYTFVANGESTIVPTESGGNNYSKGNQSVSYSFSKSKELAFTHTVMATNFNGPASCQIYRDGVLVDEETSNGSYAHCSVPYSY